MRENHHPKVSVVMPVFNGAKFINEAIKSILSQTFTDFEFIIIDDGSTDSSLEIIREFRDSRIKLLQNKKNMGIIKTLNLGLKIATGEYIARMDCDDISLSQRFAKQISFLENNRKVGVLGCNVRIVDEKLNTVSFVNRPLTNYQNKWCLLFDCPIMHPTVMFRKSLVDNYSDYSEYFIHAEDYELWSRLSQYTEINQLGEILLLLRKHDKNIGCRYSKTQLETHIKISQNNIYQLFGHNSLNPNKTLIIDYFNNSQRIKPPIYNILTLIMIYQQYIILNKLCEKDIRWIKNDMSIRIFYYTKNNISKKKLLNIYCPGKVSFMLVIQLMLLGIINIVNIKFNKMWMKWINR